MAMVVVGASTQGVAPSTPAAVVSRAGPATRVAGTRVEAGSRVAEASKAAAVLLRAEGRVLVVALIRLSKVLLIILVWGVERILYKVKVVAWERWQDGHGYHYRPRDTGASMQSRAGLDADLLQQTVQAVVAAVTAATKVAEPTPGASPTVGLSGGAGQHAMTSVATSNAAQQATLVVQDNQGMGAKARDNEGQGPQKKKKEEKSGCFRCKQPGHHIDDCPTPFCDLCESVHHATHACHLHQAPKPTSILHGYANEALMFFELACGAFKAKVENPRLAKVIVDGDAMTIPELIDQLKKIVPSEKFIWEVFHFKDNIYRVKLPSKQEVQRLKNLGTYICNDRESCLVFDSCSSLEEPMYSLPEVWVRVSGLPSDIISDYLSLWGVGTLFGKTLDVDMAYTRRNKVLRTKIGCLDRSLIPKDCDMFIRRGFFKLFFEVEEGIGNTEVDMVEVNNGGDENDDANNGEHNKEGGNAMDMDPKGQDGTNNANNGVQDGASISDGVQGMQLAHTFGEINIGSLKVPLSPTGVLGICVARWQRFGARRAAAAGDLGPGAVC
ncbi:hypothetical protein ACQ4PT_001433 [Festuca glaucescens]